MHGKLIDGRIVYAPNCIIDGDRTIYNPPGDMLVDEGWMPIVATPYPVTDEETDIAYTDAWAEQDGQIVQVWTEVEHLDDAPREPTLDERVTDVEGAVIELAELVAGMVMDSMGEEVE